MKKTVTIALVLAFAALVGAGCFTHTYTIGAGAPDGEEVYKEKWADHWFFGIVETHHLDLKTVCPSGNATIKDEVSAVNAVVGFFTGIVWFPSTVTVLCSASAADIEMTPELAALIATDFYFLDWVQSVDPSLLPQAEIAISNAEAFLAEQALASR